MGVGGRGGEKVVLPGWGSRTPFGGLITVRKSLSGKPTLEEIENKQGGGINLKLSSGTLGFGHTEKLGAYQSESKSVEAGSAKTPFLWATTRRSEKNNWRNDLSCRRRLEPSLWPLSLWESSEKRKNGRDWRSEVTADDRAV